MKNILLAEYSTLKSEQLARIKHRDNLIYVALGAMGTLFSFAMIHDAAYVVSLIPMVSLVLCWLYISNDRKISEIGNYIGHDLPTLFKKYTSEEEMPLEANDMFYWEKRHMQYAGRKTRKKTQYVIDLLVFVFPSLVSCLIIWFKEQKLLGIVSIVFVLAIIGLFVIHYSAKEITKEEADFAALQDKTL